MFIFLWMREDAFPGGARRAAVLLGKWPLLLGFAAWLAAEQAAAAEREASAYAGPHSPSVISAPAAMLPGVVPGRAPFVPKTLDALRRQVGEDFTCLAYGEILVASDLCGGQTREIVDGLVAYVRESLAVSFFETPPDGPVTAYLLRDEDSYRRNLRDLFGMEPISPYGHYGHRQRYVIVNYATGAGTLVHELVHALMAPDFPEAPIWLAEGLASLYEQSRAENGRLYGEDNWRRPELEEALSKGALPSLGTLFSHTPKAFRETGESLNYALARYFCFYLQERGALERVYRAFRAGWAEDGTGARFVEEILKKPLERVEADFRRWLAEGPIAPGE